MYSAAEKWDSYSCSSHGHRQQEQELGNPLFRRGISLGIVREVGPKLQVAHFSYAKI